MPACHLVYHWENDVMTQYSGDPLFLPFSLYYLQPLNQKLYHHVLSLIKSGNYTGRVKPSGGVIFHE